MSDATEPQGPGSKPKKPLLPPSRIVFLIFVVAALVVIVIQYQARSAFQASFEAVDQALNDANNEGQPLYRADVDKLLQGSPSRDHDEAAGSEIITWRGVLQSYCLRLEYGEGGFVERIETK